MADAATVVIDLGTKAELTDLYSYPNKPESANPGPKESLPKTILHWFKQTLVNDGFTGTKAATAKVVANGKRYELHLTGPSSLKKYKTQLPQFLDHGRAALKRIVEIQAEDLDRAEKAKSKGAKAPKNHWDPRDKRDWRFFLPLGLPLVHQKSIQFFHYPPIRLLETNRDYLDDPVPKRWEELLEANGVKPADVALYEAVMDAVPVGASDAEGSAPDGGMPIDDFVEYQKSQVDLLLGKSKKPGFTLPIVVYGASPRKRFWNTYRAGFSEAVQKAGSWGIADPQRVQIKSGCQTPVLAMNHPYSFFMDIQKQVGEEFVPGVTKFWKAGLRKMIESLAAARWQKLMATDPSQDPDTVYSACLEYWGSWPTSSVQVTKNGKTTTKQEFLDANFKPAAKQKQRDAVAAILLHQGSLEAGLSGTWKFVRDLATAQNLVAEFKSQGAVKQESLLAAEKAGMINELLKFVCG